MIKVGSWQFFALTLGIVIVIFLLCQYWDWYDKQKQRKIKGT